MRRRHCADSPVAVSAEVLEVRALLSSATAPVAGAFGMHGHSVPVQHNDILSHLSSSKPISASTVPGNGDVNPYGAAFVPQGFPSGGALNPGDLLVSNFNNSSGLQGTGTTIVRVTPQGKTSTFFQGQAGLGLTTALGVLKNGFVIVGNLPTTDGTPATAQQGSLLILDKKGHLVETLTDPNLLDGPWDLTINDMGSFAQVFVSNALSGTVTRIDMLVPRDTGMPEVLAETQIASGFAHTTDPNALLLGPTGLAFDRNSDTLYVASTADNAIYAISNAQFRLNDAGTGTVAYQDATHLHGPLGLVLAPNGDLIVSNGDAVNPDANHSSELVEFTPQGKFVSQFQVDPAAGGAFGIALSNVNGQIRFAAVDDITNTVKIWNLHGQGGQNGQGNQNGQGDNGDGDGDEGGHGGGNGGGNGQGNENGQRHGHVTGRLLAKSHSH
jgi:sugar lactone lactonase YvrE